MLTWSIGLVSIALGIAYMSLGVLACFEVLVDRKVLGVSQFGLGFALMASSCGPHHLLHGRHALAGLDVSATIALATVIGVPCGLVFVALRIEAMFGGRGDRFVIGTPNWLAVAPIGFLLGAGMIVGAEVTAPGFHLDLWSFVALPNLVVTVTYALVGWPLIRTQFRRRSEVGGWSLSGLALAGIFPTCALTHLTYALSAGGDVHTGIVDLWGVPASLYFLWVVRALYRDAIVDWNRRPVAGVRGRAPRPSPWSGETIATDPLP